VLDCGNSGTTMRLLAGVLAASDVEAVLDGDASLGARPMERVAEPLRRMGAGVETTDGHAPVTVKGAALQGIRHESRVPSAQVKSAILLAGIGADGRTEVVEPTPTRDHTERALRALGASVFPVDAIGAGVERFDVPSFAASVPGDVSSAAFVAGAAVVTGGVVELAAVGLNPTRTRYLDVLERMGARVDRSITAEQLGEPLGSLRVAAGGGLRGTVVTADELPEVVDEVPLLAAVAGHAEGETRFEGAAELRVKESDRLAGLRDLLRDLGGDADLDGDSLVIEGGGLRGGTAGSTGDHRMAMAAVVAALAASGPSLVDGAEAAAVSFPGFAEALRGIGARLEER
jgi:3-phosphoshikimate 1-carboxyvinyltransferase